MTAESKYALVDKVNEKKYNFKLTDALKRAKDAKSKLLEGQTFYSTSKISLDSELFKRIILSSGGKVFETSTQLSLPTVKIFV